MYYQLNHDKQKLKEPAVILIALNLVAIIIAVINLESGWLYYIETIDNMKIYNRGEYHVIFPLLTLAMLCFTCVYVLAKKKNVEKKRNIT